MNIEVLRIFVKSKIADLLWIKGLKASPAQQELHNSESSNPQSFPFLHAAPVHHDDQRQCNTASLSFCFKGLHDTIEINRIQNFTHPIRSFFDYTIRY